MNNMKKEIKSIPFIVPLITLPLPFSAEAAEREAAESATPNVIFMPTISGMAI